MFPLPGMPGMPPLPSLALDFSAGPSNAAQSTPISIGGVNTAAGGGIDLTLVVLVAAAWFLLR